MENSQNRFQKSCHILQTRERLLIYLTRSTRHISVDKATEYSIIRLARPHDISPSIQPWVPELNLSCEIAQMHSHTWFYLQILYIPCWSCIFQPSATCLSNLSFLSYTLALCVSQICRTNTPKKGKETSAPSPARVDLYDLRLVRSMRCLLCQKHRTCSYPGRISIYHQARISNHSAVESLRESVSPDCCGMSGTLRHSSLESE